MFVVPFIKTYNIIYLALTKAQRGQSPAASHTSPVRYLPSLIERGSFSVHHPPLH